MSSSPSSRSRSSSSSIRTIRSGRLKSRGGKHNIAYFYDEVYGVNVHLVWPVDGQKLRQYLHRQFPGEDYTFIDDDWKARCISQSFKDGEVHVIALRQWANTAADIAMLVHECMHACSFTLHPRGIELTPQHDEPYAYYMDMLVRRSLELIRSVK